MKNKLTEKQIVRLRKNIRYQKLAQGTHIFMCLVFLVAGCIKLFQTYTLCKISGTLHQVLDIFLSGVKVRQTYSGAEVLANEWLTGVLLYFSFSIVILAFYFVMKMQDKRDRLLLEYIEKEKEDGETTPS